MPAVETRTKTYFLSDLHLGASYLDRPHLRERMVAEFLKEVEKDGRDLFLVGDILDYWFEYKTVVPRGYVRFFGALAALADSGVRITWLTGNHDIWLFDYLRDEIGIAVVDGSVSRKIDGKNFYISHGDRLGKRPAGFRFIQSFFRNRVCQKLYAAIHPRWTVGFAHRWSSANRNYKKTPTPRFEGKLKENVIGWAQEFVAEHPTTDYIVLGHHHVAVEIQVSEHTKLIITGDWLYNFTYGVWDGKKFEIKQFAKACREFNNISLLIEG